MDEKLRAALAPIISMAERIAHDASRATKGPWSVGPSSDDNGVDPVEIAVLASGGECVAVTICLPPDEHVANTRLIAALPEMVSAILTLAIEVRNRSKAADA